VSHPVAAREAAWPKDPAAMKKPIALPRRELEKVSEINFRAGV